MDKRQQLELDLNELVEKINRLGNNVKSVEFQPLEKEWGKISAKLAKFDRFIIKETSDGWPVLDYADPFDEAAFSEDLISVGDIRETLERLLAGNPDLLMIDGANVFADVSTSYDSYAGDDELDLDELEQVLNQDSQLRFQEVVFDPSTNTFTPIEDLSEMDTESTLKEEGLEPTDLKECRIPWHVFTEEVGPVLATRCKSYCSHLDECNVVLNQNVKVLNDLVNALAELDSLMTENMCYIASETRQQTGERLSVAKSLLEQYLEFKEMFGRFRAALPANDPVPLPRCNYEERRPFPDAWAV